MDELEIRQLVQENTVLKEQNEKLKNALYIPKIVNTIFDYFMFVNKNISTTIESLDSKSTNS
jgi:regulator of replication initiation timing